MRKPVITESEFEKQHMLLDNMLRKYRVSERGRNMFSPRMKEHLSLRHAESLKAINPLARTTVARALAQAVTAEFDNKNIETAFFITIVSDEFAVTVDRKQQFDTAKAKSWIKSILKGFDYIGFWEAAFYYRSPFLENGHEPRLSWHAHVIAWNVGSEDIEKIQAEINEQVRAFLPGYDAFHCRSLSSKWAIGRIFYMSKGCLSEYTAYPKVQEVIDPETGEIKKVAQDIWSNRKRPIRPGSLAKVTLAIGSRSIRSLCFGGGKGKELRNVSLKNARRALVRDRQARKALIKRALRRGKCFGESPRKKTE